MIPSHEKEVIVLKQLLGPVSLLILLFAHSSVSFGSEFIKEVEKDYGLRSIGHLQISNPKGDISVQGWAFDKIRVKVRKRVTAESAESAKPLFDSLDYRYQVSEKEKDIEISTQYGNGLSIMDRLHEQDRPRVYVDMTVFAPSNMKLGIWSVNGKVSLKAWNASAEIRSGSGFVRVEGVKSDSLSLTCPTCSAQLRNIRGSVNCLGGSGQLELSHIHGKQVYVETSSGPIKVSHVQGEQLYISKTGLIDGQFLQGRIEFSSQKGGVELRELSGFLSGLAESGNIVAQIRAWEFSDKALIESNKGNITLTLPQRFSGDVDIWSLHGKTDVDFAIEKSQDLATFGPEPANHLVGRVRDGGELLKIFTDSGDVRVLKGKL